MRLMNPLRDWLQRLPRNRREHVNIVPGQLQAWVSGGQTLIVGMSVIDEDGARQYSVELHRADIQRLREQLDRWLQLSAS